MEKFLFQINFKDFGPVKNAEIEVHPLTVFVGPNNTGKTYVAYFIWNIVSSTFFPLLELLIPIPIRYSFYKFSTKELLPSNFFGGNKIISKLS